MSINEEQKEYEEFWIKATQKATEIDRDFHNLSMINQKRIREEMEMLIQQKGVAEIIKCIADR